MEEKRKAPRIEEESEVTIIVSANGHKFPKSTVTYNRGKDISASGIRISTNIFLTVDALRKMDIKLEYLQHKISALGKVKWVKVIVEDESYELGVQFVSSPREALKQLADYVSWRLKEKKT